MNQIATRRRAQEFAKKWSKYNGKESGNVGRFWYELLGNVYEISHVTDYLIREKSVPKFDKKSHDFIDVYIPSTKVIIEQKAPKYALDEPEYRPSFKNRWKNGYVTPFEQASGYNNNLSNEERAHFIITSNFHEIWIYDLDKGAHPTPIKLKIKYLPQNVDKLRFLINSNDADSISITKLSKKASYKIADIYKALVNQCKKYGTTKNGILDKKGKVSEHSLKDLNKLCVRLVFCFYADFSGIFNNKHGVGMFKRYLIHQPDWRAALINLFNVLETPKRSPFNKLKEFHYTDGNLFKDQIDIPPINDHIKRLILNAMNFDWSQISPTIFGAMFESTIGYQQRKNNGMHYTSVKNIHKVIDPLFLNKLKDELNNIKHTNDNQLERARNFQNKLAHLKFLDPACGSGNFLTETYLCLRKLENQVIRIIFIHQYNNSGRGSRKYHSQKLSREFQSSLNLGRNLDSHNHQIIKVSIKQFYGIEIDDFAVSVAKTAMWIAESQMYQQTQDILFGGKDFLPLKENTNIIEADALTYDWNALISSNNINYIISNPPFRGNSLKTKKQKADMRLVMKGLVHGYNNLDFCTTWFIKSIEYMKSSDNKIHTCLVATNSISQGRQVSLLWNPLTSLGAHLDFAYHSFKWSNDAKNEASVYCVIEGFSIGNSSNKKLIYKSDSSTPALVNHINGYLKDMPDLLINQRSNPLCNVPRMDFGNTAIDKGYLSKWSTTEVRDTCKKYPKARKCFRRLLGSREFLHNNIRWCLWLKDVGTSLWEKIPAIKHAVLLTQQYRSHQTRHQTQEASHTPSLFAEIRQPVSKYNLLIPANTSGRRNYIPIAIVNGKDIISNSCLFIPHATIFIFGILESSVHMWWMRLVAGRLKNDYRYSAKIVYNNFPWPLNLSKNVINKINKTAGKILTIRKSYPNSNLAGLYGLGMKPDLMKAHLANDRAVLKAYGLNSNASNNDIIKRLVDMYNNLTKKK